MGKFVISLSAVLMINALAMGQGTVLIKKVEARKYESLVQPTGSAVKGETVV
jgi:hypothetical protein